jgi:hypothetical protein
MQTTLDHVTGIDRRVALVNPLTRPFFGWVSDRNRPREYNVHRLGRGSHSAVWLLNMLHNYDDYAPRRAAISDPIAESHSKTARGAVQDPRRR